MVTVTLPPATIGIAARFRPALRSAGRWATAHLRPARAITRSRPARSRACFAPVTTPSAEPVWHLDPREAVMAVERSWR
jgi:hypothetical protein